MKILHLDTNHKLLINQLNDLGFTNHEDYKSPKPEIEAKISEYDGIIIRSRFLISGCRKKPKIYRSFRRWFRKY